MSHSSQEWVALCETVKQLVPTEISEQAWVLVTVSLANCY